MAIALIVWGGTLLQFVRESLMQSASSTHYTILFPTGALSQNAMKEFAERRERAFAAMQKKLGGDGTDTTIRIVVAPDYRKGSQRDVGQSPAYLVSGTTIRTKPAGQYFQLPAAADAEALLHHSWGKPGNAEIAKWVAVWLSAQSTGVDLGMAAAQVEQRLGHKKVESLLADPGGEISAARDRDALGAAWIAETAEFGGTDAIRKLYAADILHLNIAEVTKTLNTTPLELDRKWQLWMYAYLAGMPSMPGDSAMPMKMPMPPANPVTRSHLINASGGLQRKQAEPSRENSLGNTPSE
jgi:hypothetical protein